LQTIFKSKQPTVLADIMTAETIIEQILQKHPELSQEQIRIRLSVARNMTGGLIADESLDRKSVV
jgi:hypothetical protein